MATHSQVEPGDRGRVSFSTALWMPSLIYKACVATGIQSNTAYCQRALCEALARDLGLDLDGLLANLPPTRTSASHLFTHTLDRSRLVGQGDTIEDVR